MFDNKETDNNTKHGHLSKAFYKTHAEPPEYHTN